MTLPRWASVAALYALTNSMMLTPCWPRAGPTGGAGVAAPAWICSLMKPETFFFLGGIAVGPFLVAWAYAVGDDPVAGPPDEPRTSLGQILATWLNDSSTGVSRPKIDTSTLSFWLSALISEIVAGRVSNGPSMTVTDSPTSKSTTLTSVAFFVPGLPVASSLVSRLGASMVKTSSRLSGTGWWVWPTKPVTPGVWRTAPQLSSVRSMRTRTYPGIRTRRTSLRWPFLISVTSSMGTSTWKM